MTGTDLVAPQRKSVVRDMANRFGMEADTFEATVRATCMPTGRDVAPMSREEFAAGIMVAEKYTLNPILREIYFYPRKGGGIVPVVSIDGWVSLINRRKELDGIEFKDDHDATGKLISVTCIIYRSDRKHPTIVTEYLSECIRDTIPWKMPHRMLRHKALIQGARYAFGFAGIHDEDEAERIVAAVALQQDRPPAPPAEVIAEIEGAADRHERPTQASRDHVEEAEIVESQSAQEGTASGKDETEAPFDFDAWIEDVSGTFSGCRTDKDLDEASDLFSGTAEELLTRPQRERYDEMLANAYAALEKVAAGQKADARPAAQPSTQQDGPGAPPPEDDDEDDSFGTPAEQAAPAKTPAEEHAEWLTAQISAPGVTTEDVQRIWNESKPYRREMIEAGKMTVEDRSAMHQRLKVVFDGLDAAEKAKNRGAAGGGTDKAATKEQPKPSVDGDVAVKAKAMTDRLKAELDAAVNVDTVNDIGTETYPEREALLKAGADPVLDNLWRTMVVNRRKTLNGI